MKPTVETALRLALIAWIAWLVTAVATEDVPQHAPTAEILVWATPVTEDTHEQDDH